MFAVVSTGMWAVMLCSGSVVCNQHTSVPRLDGESHSNSLSTTYKSVSLPLTSPNVKLNLTSPKRGQKREEGWKEVVRR